MELTKSFPAGAAVLAALALATAGTASAQVPAGTDTTRLAAADTMRAPEADLARFAVIDGDTVWIADPFDVVGMRVPAALPGMVRTVGVLSAVDIAALPVRSPAEALQTVPGVVVSQRQQYGVQSDLTIRGSTFDQVQMLLDGFDVGDPQTGHHVMNLPVGTHDLARLEVLPGQGSVLYGAGAVGGTVNAVTKRPAEYGGAGELALGAGGNGIQADRGSVNLVAPGGATGARFSAERFRTDGYDVLQDDGTMAWGGNDAEMWSGTGRVVHTGARSELDLFGGYADREFGALDYYAPTPSRERTRTLFVSAAYRRTVSDRVTLEPRVFGRRNRDHFVLFRDDPERYTNDHVSRKAGAELRGLVDLGGPHAAAFSVAAGYEDIDSEGVRQGVTGDALGQHVRRRGSAAVEIDRHGERLRWQVGGRLDTWNEFTPRFAGTGAVSWQLTGPVAVRASGGNVYRMPTFTDLYYVDPFNVGNPNLKPETGWTWDLGLEVNDGPWNARAGYFERYEQDRIEWARPVGDTIWRVLNIAEGTVRGVETGAGWSHPRGHALGLGYTWLENDNQLAAAFEGKYTLLVPRHVLTGRATAVLPWYLSGTVTGRFIQHNEGPDDFREFFVLDTRLDFDHPTGWFAALVGTNLLDRRYEEVPGVQMPGILFTGTVGRRF